MAATDYHVVIAGGGAAGIAAARRLHEAGVNYLLVEARERLGGRAWSVTDPQGHATDLGCGWLHSANRNPWTEIAAAQGSRIDKTPPPWSRHALPLNFPQAEQKEFLMRWSATSRASMNSEPNPTTRRRRCSIRAGAGTA